MKTDKVRELTIDRRVTVGRAGVAAADNSQSSIIRDSIASIWGFRIDWLEDSWHGPHSERQVRCQDEDMSTG